MFVLSAKSEIWRVSANPSAGSEVSAGKNIKLKIVYNIPGYSRKNQYILTLLLSGKRYRKHYKSIVIKKGSGTIDTDINLGQYFYSKLDAKNFHITVFLLKRSGGKYKSLYQTKILYYKQRTHIKIKNGPEVNNIKNGQVGIRNLSRGNNEKLLPGENINGEIDYSFPGTEKDRILVFFSYIIDGKKIKQTIYGTKGGSGTLKFYYTFPLAKARKIFLPAKGKEISLLFEFKNDFKDKNPPFFVFKDIKYKLIPHLKQTGGWKKVAKDKGFYPFMRQLTPIEIDGELYLYFYTHKEGIFLKQQKGDTWVDIPLPAQVKKTNSNRPTFRYIDNDLYLSFLQYKKKNKHSWYLFKRVDDQWVQLGEPIVLKNFRWGILSDNFNISPQGVLYRIYSEDYRSYLQKFFKDEWLTVKEFPQSAGYYKIEFDKYGVMYIGIGQQSGYPGVRVKKYWHGHLYDASQGLPHKVKGYIDKYKFVKYKNAFYYAFRVSKPRPGFVLYKYIGRHWYVIGKTPVAYTSKGDRGGGYSFSFYKDRPVFAYSESGMNFIPMVMSYTNRKWKPVGTPGFFPESASSIQAFEFEGKLYCCFTARDKHDREFYFYTYQYEEEP